MIAIKQIIINMPFNAITLKFNFDPKENLVGAKRIPIKWPLLTVTENRKKTVR